jgi:zinc protease
MSWTNGVVRQVLTNGLTLLAQREPSARVVAVVTHVKAGYFDEPDEWVGISHVLEHMFFKGTARRGPGAIARATRMVGGYLNASTIYDQTVYHTVLPAADGGLERALDIQADALRHPAFDPDELARELEVIIQEARRKLDNPRAVAGETLYQLLFTVHRMRRWRIGSEEGLRRLRSQDLRAYYSTRYTPDRTIVALVGDLEVDRALELASRAYGDWAPPAAALPPSPREPDGRRAVLRLLRGDVARPLAAIGWRTVEALHPDTPALDVAADLLGAGRGSRLWRAVRLPGLAAGVGAAHYTPTEVGVLELGVEAEPGRLDGAVRRALDLTADLAAREPEELEMARVRSLTQAQWAARFESMEGRGTALCQFEALGGYRLADSWYQRTLGVTGAEVRSVAERYLGSDGECAVLYLPADRPTELEGRWPPPASLEPAPPAPRPTKAARVASRSLPPDADVYAGDVTHLALPRADLLVRPKRGAGLVSLGIYAPGLREAERPETAGLATLLMRGALRGAGGLAAPELAFAAEALGGAVSTVAGTDVSGWAITVPAPSAGQAVSLLRSIALEPALEEGELRRERLLQADDAARVRDDMFRYPMQRALRQAFGADPYGQPQLGEPETVAHLPGDSVRAMAHRVQQCRPVAVAVGDLSARELLDCLAPLTDWPSTSEPGIAARAAGSPSWTPGCGFERREKAQTALALAFPAPPAASPDRFVLEVTGALLSGLAGRLFEALRERRSLAYAVSALPWLRRRGGAVLAYIATSPERESEARQGMLDQLERLGREPVSTEELEGARRYAAGLAEIGRQHAASVASDILDAWVSGTLADWHELPQRLRAVSAEDVARVGVEVFRREVVAEYAVRGGERG